MKQNKHTYFLFSLTIGLFVIISNLLSQPEFPLFFYHANLYAPFLHSQNLRCEDRPDSAFTAFTRCKETVIAIGYPSHSGFVKGINDTCWISLKFSNYSTSDIDLIYESPETWIIPYVYNSYADLMADRYSADTSDFDYEFSHWRNPKSSGKPDTLYSHLVSDIMKFNPAEMVYKVWNLPEGLKAIELKKSSNAPSTLQLYRQQGNFYWYSNGTDVRDSINAYIKLSQRCIELGQATTAASWLDSVFARNDSSIAGWIYKADVCSALDDSSGVVDAFNRLISIYDNNSDPLINLADTTLTESCRLWADFYYRATIFRKYYFTNDDGKPVIIF